MYRVIGNGVWVQEGVCKPDKCDAWCCRHVSWRERAKDIDPSDIRWYKYHGVQVKRIIENGEDMLHFLMMKTCEKLNPKLLNCMVYGTRPHSCRQYARHPKDAFWSDECTVHWRKLPPSEALPILRRMRK